MAKKYVYLEHDRVRIINPVVVKRVGYPFDIHAEAERVGKDNYADINALFDKILPEYAPNSLDREHYSYHNLAMKIAFIVGRYRGLGGKDRQLWTETQPDLVNHRWAVVSKRTVRTGCYYAPGGGYTYDGDYDYEPGGLQNAKSHVLLTLSRCDWLGEPIEIEACNVEPELQTSNAP